MSFCLNNNPAMVELIVLMTSRGFDARRLQDHQLFMNARPKQAQNKSFATYSTTSNLSAIHFVHVLDQYARRLIVSC